MMSISLIWRGIRITLSLFYDGAAGAARVWNNLITVCRGGASKGRSASHKDCGDLSATRGTGGSAGLAAARQSQSLIM